MFAFYLGMLENDDDKMYLTHLYLTHERTMYATALGILRVPAAAEDAVHDSFIKVIRNFSLCRQIPDNKIGAWLVMIVKNTSIDMLRKSSKTVELDSLDYFPDEIDDIAAWSGYADLKELLRQLPLIYRTTLGLKYLEGRSDREIAELLGISESTVRSRIFQARNLLKKGLSHFNE